MNTMKELKQEIAELKHKLSKAVIFEISPGIVIGLSEEDNLWRVRRDDMMGILFLNKDNLWEEGPIEEEEAFALRTGYKSSEEALSAYEQYLQSNPMLYPDYEQSILNIPLIHNNILKNN